MNKLTSDEIEPLPAYAAHRPAAREAAIAHRARRRVQLGDRLSLSFEDRATVRYQIQEMCHAERLTEPHQVAGELAAYNDLIPGPGEISATLMIEITDPGDIRGAIDGFLGLDQPGVVTLRVGSSTIPAQWAPGHSKEDRIAAVQYVKFRIPPAAQAALAAATEAFFVVAHPRYAAMARVDDRLREELLRDLSG